MRNTLSAVWYLKRRDDRQGDVRQTRLDAFLRQGVMRSPYRWYVYGVVCCVMWGVSPWCVQAAIVRVPGSYPTIQAGVMAAQSGDTVLVAPGVYYERVTMKTGVHLHGEPGAILDGSRGDSPLVLATSGVEQTAVLSGFVIRYSRHAGILLNQAAPTLRNNVILENAGPGIACAQASPQLFNNVFVANAGAGIVCEYPGTAPTITYNNFWQNQPQDILGCTPGVGNRYDAPGFVDAVAGNYRLQATSPLINAGNPDPVWRDKDGSRSDIGVYGGPPPPLIAPPARVTSDLLETFFGTSTVLRNSLSTRGMPGLIHVPTATMVPEGSVDLGYNVTRDRTVFPGVDRQKSFGFALGLLPRLTIGGRGVVATDTDTGLDLARDISANAQVLLVEDHSWWPSIAVGLQDIGGGATFFRSRYVVLSKSLFGRLRGTVGFGAGPDVLDGPFGGVELALNQFVTVMGEYDTKVFNAGLRLFPFPERWEAYGIPRPTVDVLWQDGRHVSWGISIRAGLGEAKFHAQREARAEKRYSRRSQRGEAELSLQAVSERLQAALIDRGLENVRITIARLDAGLTVVVEYENRRYNRDELDALGLVLGLAALETPSQVTHMRVIVQEVNVPVLEVSSSVEAFLAFLNAQMSAAAFAQQLRMTQEVQWPLPALTPEARTSMRERSWLKLDIFLRPGIETQILTEVGVADMRFSLLPDAYLQLTPGTVLNVRAAIPVTRTAAFAQPLGDPAVDRVLAHQALRLPIGRWWPGATGLTQVSLGRFSREEVGIAHETALTLVEGVALLKGTWARLGPSYGDLDHWVALANGRVRYPPWDLTLSVTAGRFLDGDQGVAADVSRFFGNTEIGVFLRHSDHGSQAGLRFAMPLTLSKELPPWRVRPRLPDVYAYEQRTTVFTNTNVIRNDIGRELNTGHAVERVYWNRDRLYPAYIRYHVDTLRQAVRRWIDDEAENVSMTQEK